MEVTVEAGNAGEAAWLDDDGRPQRAGTFWTASAHIITAVIGSGVLSLAWAIAQLGWVAGPAAMLLFAFVTYYTATLLAECYRTGDPETGKRNYTYMDAVNANLSTCENPRARMRHSSLYSAAVGPLAVAEQELMTLVVSPSPSVVSSSRWHQGAALRVPAVREHRRSRHRLHHCRLH